MKTFLPPSKMRKLLLGSLFSLCLIVGLTNNLFAQIAQPITLCSGASIVIKGDAASPTPTSYGWELFKNNVWGTAPGVANTADYTPSALTNLTTSPVVFSIRRKIVTSSASAYDSYYDVTTLPSAAISGNNITAPAVVAFCAPGNPAVINGSAPTGGNGTFGFQWQSSTDNANFTNINGANATNYAPGALNITTYFRRVVTGSSCVASSISNVVTITVFSVLSNNTITAPGQNTFCQVGGTAAVGGNIPSGGDGTYTYQWQTSTDNANFTDIPGAINQTYIAPAASVTTYFRRAAVSGLCSVPNISNVVAITILSAPTNNVITAPSLTSFCLAGDPALISGSVPTNGSGTYSYQWQQSTDNVNFVNVTGATTKDFDPTIINATTYYRRTVTSGSCVTPVISNVIAFTIVAPPTVPLTVQPVVTVCPGNPAVLSVTNPQTGITYNWYDTATKTNLLFTGATYTTAPITVAATFYVESSNGFCTSPSTASVQVNISAAPLDPTLVNNPTNTCSGASATITISSPQAGISYNWFATATSSSILFTGTSFTTPVLSANASYYVQAVNAGGCTSNRVEAKVTILPNVPPVANNSVTAPPVTTFCLVGDPSTIIGDTPSGASSFTYQWQQSTDNITFTDIAGAITKDYDPPVITTTTYFRRIVSPGACSAPLMSNDVAVKISTPPTNAPTVQPVVTVCPGSAASLSVNNPQSGFVYNWYDSPTKTTLLATGVTYTTKPLIANTIFYVESSNGSCSSPTAASVEVDMAVAPTAPALTQDTVKTCSETIAVFAIANPQAGFTYNWYSSVNGGTPVGTGVNFATPSLTASTIYYAEAVNATGCNSLARTSATAILTPLPQFAVTSAAVCPGSSAILTASTSEQNVVLSWFTTATGGTPIITSDTLNIPAVNAPVSYYVEAVNTVTGCISSSRKLVQATLLQPLAAPVVALNGVTANSVTFNWAVVNGATAYQVSVDNGNTFNDPSTGAAGLSHTVSSLTQNQSVSLVVRAIGSSGCQLSANSAAVSGRALNLSDDIYVPNAFTPNGDGNNDVVHVHSEGIKALDFKIYTQWGQLVFSSVDITNGWDGTYKGSKEPLGVYTYSLSAVMNNGDQVNKKGTITLLK